MRRSDVSLAAATATLGGALLVCPLQLRPTLADAKPPAATTSTAARVWQVTLETVFRREHPVPASDGIELTLASASNKESVYEWHSKGGTGENDRYGIADQPARRRELAGLLPLVVGRSQTYSLGTSGRWLCSPKHTLRPGQSFTHELRMTVDGAEVKLVFKSGDEHPPPPPVARVLAILEEAVRKEAVSCRD